MLKVGDRVQPRGITYTVGDLVEEVNENQFSVRIGNQWFAMEILELWSPPVRLGTYVKGEWQE